MKLSEDTVKKLEEAFAIGSDVSAACYYADISRQTYYNWEKDNPELKAKFDRLKEKPVLKAYQTVAKDLDKIDTAKWYLSKKRKTEFGNDLDLTSGGKPINLNFDGTFKTAQQPETDSPSKE